MSGPSSTRPPRPYGSSRDILVTREILPYCKPKHQKLSAMVMMVVTVIHRMKEGKERKKKKPSLAFIATGDMGVHPEYLKQKTLNMHADGPATLNTKPPRNQKTARQADSILYT